MGKESVVEEKPEYFNQMYFLKEGRSGWGKVRLGTQNLFRKIWNYF